MPTSALLLSRLGLVTGAQRNEISATRKNVEF
jgi:hypothetical protein